MLYYSSPPDFKPEVISTLSTICLDEDKGKKASTQCSSQSTNKKGAALLVGITFSFLNMRSFAEAHWSSKGLLEVLKMDEDLFVFGFQSEESKQSILESSRMPFGNRVYSSGRRSQANLYNGSNSMMSLSGFNLPFSYGLCLNMHRNTRW